MTSDPAVTIAFGDPGGGWYGLASTSGLAVLFRDRELAGVASGEDLALRMTEEAAGERWAVDWDGGECGFALEAVAAAAPIEHDGGAEQLARVSGTVRASGAEERIDAPGQVSRVREPDWSTIVLVRAVSAWFEDGGIVLESLRPEGAAGHDAERMWAALVEDGEPAPVADPRLSTTYDGDGHQRRAGLELWTTEEDGFPYRAAGSVICGSSLDLGELSLDLAFFRWSAHGREGVGRYDILRRRA